MLTRDGSGPVLKWTHRAPGTSLRYYDASVLACHLFVNPHGWVVYYNAPGGGIEERRGSLARIDPEPADVCMAQAEAAARELLLPLKDSGEIEQWAALWGAVIAQDKAASDARCARASLLMCAEDVETIARDACGCNRDDLNKVAGNMRDALVVIAKADP